MVKRGEPSLRRIKEKRGGYQVNCCFDSRVISSEIQEIKQKKGFKYSVDEVVKVFSILT